MLHKELLHCIIMGITTRKEYMPRPNTIVFHMLNLQWLIGWQALSLQIERVHWTHLWDISLAHAPTKGWWNRKQTSKQEITGDQITSNDSEIKSTQNSLERIDLLKPEAIFGIWKPLARKLCLSVVESILSMAIIIFLKTHLNLSVN